MRAKIKNREEIAQGTLLVNLDLLGQDIDFIPGQYFSLTLPNMPYHDKKGKSRFFSIVNSPDEKGILTIATRISDSAFKKSLKEIPIGTEVEIGYILGEFVLPDDTSRPIVFITGGIGITPMISMLRHIKANNLAYKITLIYSNRNREAAAFLSELEALEKQNSNFKLISTLTGDPNWPGEKRRIDIDFIKEYLLDYKFLLYYISGPPEMVSAIKKVLTNAGIGKRNIKTENFLGY